MRLSLAVIMLPKIEKCRTNIRKKLTMEEKEKRNIPWDAENKH